VIGLATAHVQGSFKIEYKARAMFVDQTLGISSVYCFGKTSVTCHV